MRLANRRNVSWAARRRVTIALRWRPPVQPKEEGLLSVREEDLGLRFEYMRFARAHLCDQKDAPELQQRRLIEGFAEIDIFQGCR